MLDPIVALTGALALAALLAAAAVHKLAVRGELAGVIANYRILPAPLVRPVAALLPMLEMLLAAALVVPATRTRAAAAAALLLLAYGAALALNLARGRRHIDCGCLGSRLGPGIAGWMVARNALLALLALGLRLPLAPRPLALFDALVALALAATLALLYPIVEIVARPALPTFDQNFAASRAGRPRPGA